MLVVIDRSVADYHFLAASVLPGAETIVLEPHRDAIAQITMALARHREYQSLHIVCHGEPGKLYLGKTCLSAENLAPYRQQLLEWGVAEILLYSCEVAAGEIGTAFVEQLSRLTGADIAASASRVGNAALGGSWHLESYCGDVSAGLAFVPEVVRDYTGVFADLTIDSFNLVGFTQGEYQVNEDGTVVGVPVTIERAGLTNFTSTIDVQLIDGSATGGDDFDSTTIPVAFAVGQTYATVVIPIIDDESFEETEDLTLELTNGSFGTVLGLQNTASLEILDNEDQPLPVDPATGLEYYPGEILVKFSSNTSDSQILNFAQINGVVEAESLVSSAASDSPLAQWQVLEFDPEIDLLQTRNSLAANSGVEEIELNYRLSTAMVPNDTDFSKLWGLHNTGQTGGTPNVDINAPEAWDIQTGSSDIVVAVIDTGIEYTHPDLASNAWSNPGEILGDGMDNDGNGYVDDVYGYDFANSDGDPMDDHGHGTHVAGTIGATGNNNSGVVGVNHSVGLMALKFLDNKGNGSTSDAIKAVQYATKMGANVINASWGGGGFSKALSDAISDANDAGILFVAAAGNKTSDNDKSPYYPSGYDLPNVISVAATDHKDQLASFSNYGATTVDMGAPGVGIWSTFRGNQYASASGTSMAAPHVAGAAALLMAEYPSFIDNPENLKSILVESGKSIPALNGKTLSGKRLNLYEAITNNPPVYDSRNHSLPHQGRNWTGNPALRRSLKFTFHENTFVDSDPGDRLTYSAVLLSGRRGVPVKTLPNTIASTTNTITFNPATRTFSMDPSMRGDNWIRVTATDSYGATASGIFHIYRNGSGIAIDNYIAGGTAFLDANKNEVLDPGEPFDITNEKGEFDIDIDFDIFDSNNNGFIDPEEGNFVIVGGTDIATGLPLATPITATPDSFIVSMLTSVLAELVDGGLSQDEAETKLLESLSLPDNLPITYIDPISATEDNEEGGAEVFSGMIEVQNTVTLIASLLDGASSASISELTQPVVGAIASKIQADDTLDLSAADTLEAVIQDAVNQALVIDPDLDSDAVLNIKESAAEVIAESNQRIEDAATNNTGSDITTEVAKVQKIALGETASDLKEAVEGTKTIEEVVAENTGVALDDKIENAQVKSAAPTDMELSDTSVAENQPIGTEVGTFSTIDPDAGETHSYSLVPGEGDTDNDSFDIVDNSLRTSETFDYETQDAYNIRVQTTDGNGGVYWEQFTIDVTEAENTVYMSINGTPGRDALTATDGDDILTGLQGRDTLTGGTGSDQFVYTSILDAGDIITDFEVGSDKIVLGQVLDSLGYDGTDPIADRYIGLRSRGDDTIITIDPDGPGSGRSRSFVLVQDVTLPLDPSNFVF